MSDVAGRMADLTAPILCRELDAWEPTVEREFCAVGRLFIRRGVAAVKPHARPICLQVATAALDHLATVSLADLAMMLVEHATSRGIAAHATILRAHP